MGERGCRRERECTRERGCRRERGWRRERGCGRERPGRRGSGAGGRRGRGRDGGRRDGRARRRRQEWLCPAHAPSSGPGQGQRAGCDPRPDARVTRGRGHARDTRTIRRHRVFTRRVRDARAGGPRRAGERGAHPRRRERLIGRRRAQALAELACLFGRDVVERCRQSAMLLLRVCTKMGMEELANGARRRLMALRNERPKLGRDVLCRRRPLVRSARHKTRV